MDQQMDEKEKQDTAEVVADSTVTTVEPEIIDNGNAIHLSKPLNGKDVLILDFDRINGRVLIACEKRARKLDPAVMVLSLSLVYQALVGAAAAGIKYDEALELSGNDFNALCIKAQGFLFR